MSSKSIFTTTANKPGYMFQSKCTNNCIIYEIYLDLELSVGITALEETNNLI